MLEDWEDSVNIGKLFALARINWFHADETRQLSVLLGAGIVVRVAEKSCSGVSFCCLGKKIVVKLMLLWPKRSKFSCTAASAAILYLFLALEDTKQRARRVVLSKTRRKYMWAVWINHSLLSFEIFAFKLDSQMKMDLVYCMRVVHSTVAPL